ncbi:hypothetical protein D915_002265 [Fasciola hepatica]|uniref:Ig-like domain-containing protein n=1 Tax=Fasciola hepatica TaxID=6192 RepID=A0A4E0RHX7_FASHE|nr:hypothetical protein D915_002265 [Fasciola hepatica]
MYQSLIGTFKKCRQKMFSFLLWCSLFFIVRTQYHMADSATTFHDSWKQETVHFYRVPQNQSVPVGATVKLECIPRTKVQYVIWYFQPFTAPTHNFDEDVNKAAHESEPLELAMCQPNIVCKEKHGLQGLTIQPNGKLIIHPISFEHTGKYECAVVAGVHASRVHANVFVETKPSIPIIKVTDSDQTVARNHREGDPIRLLCTCAQGFPKPQLSWLRKDADHSKNSFTNFHVMQSEFPRLIFYTPNAVIPGAVQSGLLLNLSWFDHDTEIVCKAANRVGTEMSAPYRIFVTFSPRIRPFQYNPWTVVRGMSNQLICDVVSEPPAVVQWIGIDGKQLSRSPFLDSNLLVNSVINDGDTSDPSWRCNVTCVATNTIGMAERTLSIEIHCRVDTKPQSWFGPTLQINSITQEHAGTYRCVAENTVHGSGSSAMQKQSEEFSTIFVYYRPEEPVIRAHFPPELKIGAPFKLECHPNAASKFNVGEQNKVYRDTCT